MATLTLTQQRIAKARSRLRGRAGLPTGLFACAHCWLLTLWTMGVLGLGAAICWPPGQRMSRHYNLSSLGVDERVAPLFNGTLILVGGGFLRPGFFGPIVCCVSFKATDD